nr:CotH kinase family protein [uncultured Prevotella sp.]
MNLKRISILAISLLLFSTNVVSANNVNWTDFSKRFLTNTDFNQGNSDGWTIESNAGQKAVSANLMRFWNGTFDFYQELPRLPKGHYRLTVQGFYRSQGDSYSLYKNGTEQLKAFLYAGEASTPLMSVYSQAMTSTAGTRQQHDGKYYPDNSTSAAAAFDEGLYTGNSVEFDAEGSITIGVRCQEAGTNNYCAFDNFKLEYASPIGPDGKSWIDMTDILLKNPGFTNNDTNGWEWESNASSQTANYDCMEFWNGTFNISQLIKNGPQGKYRLSVQAFYRCQDNQTNWGGDYSDHRNGTQNITAYLYGADDAQQMMSIYDQQMRNYVDGCWYVEGDNGYEFYPNNMATARAAFDDEMYWNTLEFEAGGDFRVGLKCESNMNSNWCTFDNFQLEYYGDVVKVSSITVDADKNELIIGETATATATTSPANATFSWVEWSSDNEQVATIDQEGIITAHAVGTAHIIATALDGSGTKGMMTITVTRNPATSNSLFINEIMASNVDEYISPAFNFDGWIEVYNPTDRPVELGGLKISDPMNGEGPWTMPQLMGIIPANGYRLIWFDSADLRADQVPFKLDTDGGTILITDENDNVIASQDYPAAMERISYARATDQTGAWGYTGTPTPGSSNNGITLLTSQLAAPVVDQPSQLFNGSLTINVTIPGGCALRYTTDGTLPTLQNGLTSTSGQFTISNTSNYRFRLYSSDLLPSRVTTRSYILRDKDYYLPVVSVVTDPDFLYNTEIGVFEKGPNGRPGNGQSANCNWNMNWERPVNFSFLDGNGDMVLNQDVNLEMCGGWSRAFTPHSFKLKGSKEMGDEKNLPYPFFEQKPYIRNRTLQIRNGGNDTNARFKDPAIQVILQSSGIDLDCQSYQPVHEFINGSYIGVLNMREPNNKHYVYANYGWDEDEIDQFEMSPDSGYVQKCGTPDAYNELVDVLSPDAANAQTYEEICRVLDIDEFINYMAAQMYLGGTDYPQNNVKAYRYRDGGRFRFVIFDLDFAFNTSDQFNVFFGKENYTFDQLYPTSLGRIHDRIRLVTLFRNLLQNDDFRRRFIDTYCIMGGSVFETSRCESIIDELLDRVQPAMRLNGGSSSSKASEVKSNFRNRLNSAINTLKNYSTFGLSSTTARQVTLNSDVEGAKLYINGIEVPMSTFNGKLFAPAKLKAVAPAGYEFHSWRKDGALYSNKEEIDLPESNINLTAHFTAQTDAKKKQAGITPVRINEVSGSNDSFVDEYYKKGDWIELYNTTDEPVDVEGMYLSDNASKPTKYQITKGHTKAQTIIPAKGHLVIWCDKRETTDNGLHASFKIDGDGGQLILTAADKSWTDTFIYGAHDANTTIGRYPDGAAEVYAMNVATIAKSNRQSSYMTPVEQTIVNSIETPLIASANGLRVIYANQQVLVKSDEDGIATVNIFNANGMLMEQTTVSIKGGRARLDMSHLTPGLYIARAIDAGGTSVSCKFRK